MEENFKSQINKNFTNLEFAIRDLSNASLNRDEKLEEMKREIIKFQAFSVTVAAKDSYLLNLNGTDLELLRNGSVVSTIDLSSFLDQTTASNGLHEVGNDIRWGGPLTQDVEIDGNNASIYMENVAEYAFEDSSGGSLYISGSAQLSSNTGTGIIGSTDLWLRTQNAVSNSVVPGQVAVATGPGGQTEFQNAANIINFYNGVTNLGSGVGLGGDLEETTNINGDGYGLYIEDLDELELKDLFGAGLTITAGNVATLAGNGVGFIATNSAMYMKTPEQLASTTSNGEVLTLINSSSGETEFRDPNVRTIINVSATHTILPSDDIINVTANSTSTQLPTAVGITGKHYTLKNSGTGLAQLDAQFGENIDNSGLFILSQWQSVTVVSDGVNWITV